MNIKDNIFSSEKNKIKLGVHLFLFVNEGFLQMIFLHKKDIPNIQPLYVYVNIF